MFAEHQGFIDGSKMINEHKLQGITVTLIRNLLLGTQASKSHSM